MNENLIAEWNQWSELHELPDQVKRIASAKKPDLTPYKLDKESGCGYFIGSAKYETFLDRCPCSDFTKRKMPCKHMYRVAMELGLLKAEFKTGKPREHVKGNSSTQEFFYAKEKLDILSDDEQRLVYSYICNRYAGQPFIVVKKCDDILQSLLTKGTMVEISPNYEAIISIFKVSDVKNFLKAKNIEYNKSLKKAELYKWVIDECCEVLPELFCEYGCYSLSGDFDGCISHVRSYLSDKFRNEYEHIYF